MSVSNTTKRVKEICHKTRWKFSLEEKIRVVLAGPLMRPYTGQDHWTISELTTPKPTMKENVIVRISKPDTIIDLQGAMDKKYMTPVCPFSRNFDAHAFLGEV